MQAMTQQPTSVKFAITGINETLGTEAFSGITNPTITVTVSHNPYI